MRSGASRFGSKLNAERVDLLRTMVYFNVHGHLLKIREVGMKVRLKYGMEGLDLDFPPTPNFKGVLYPEEAEPLADPPAVIQRALVEPLSSLPLRELAAGKKDAVIVISDITRPVPNTVILPPLIAELESSGIRPEDITILIATGMHRPNEGAELERLVGHDVADCYRVINHFSKNDEEMVRVGEIGAGVPAFVNRHYVAADLKILTGFIEPMLLSATKLEKPQEAFAGWTASMFTGTPNSASEIRARSAMRWGM